MPEARIQGELPAISRSMTEADNNKWIDSSLDPNMHRRPDYYVHIFTVADSDLVRSLPPQLSRLSIPRRPANERYLLVTSLPHPFNQPDVDQNGKRICHYHDARRIAQDIVFPDNTSLNQDLVVDPKLVFSENSNFGRKGVFWSLNNPPTEEELVKAEKRKETYYRALLQRARELEISDPKVLQAALTADYHLAADYFGEEHSWHRQAQRRVECPNCGENIKPGVAFHFLPNGRACVTDWDRAIAAGAVAASDRPAVKKAVRAQES